MVCSPCQTSMIELLLQKQLAFKYIHNKGSVLNTLLLLLEDSLSVFFLHYKTLEICDFFKELYFFYRISSNKCRASNTVCNFQSMKSPVELNSLLSKFFCYITWYVISPDQTRLWTTCKRGLYVKSFCFFETIPYRFKNYKLNKRRSFGCPH